MQCHVPVAGPYYIVSCNWAPAYIMEPYHDRPRPNGKVFVIYVDVLMNEKMPTLVSGRFESDVFVMIVSLCI
jgi:hypothetical protein